jgi:hypothetical protein
LPSEVLFLWSDALRRLLGLVVLGILVAFTLGAGAQPASTGWVVQPSPNPGADGNYLYGAAAVSPKNVWAVGFFYNPNSETLVEHWDGTAWTVQPSPNVGMNDELLGAGAVGTATGSQAWAVGFYSALPYQTLIEHWDGAQWEIQPSPNVGSSDNSLYAVAATSASNAWAVGQYYNGTTYQTLIEHWDGTAWTVQASPNLGNSENDLTGMAAISATNAWATGWYFNGTAVQTLIEHWDGTAWTVQPSPDLGSSDNYLYAVSAASGTNAWAVGEYFVNGSRTLIIHWDGTAWTVQPSPNVGTVRNDLSGVAATSATNAWAVGHSFSRAATGHQTLIEHWDGTAWSVQPSPNVSANNYLFAAAGSSNSGWAVGIVSAGRPYRTLIERCC